MIAREPLTNCHQSTGEDRNGGQGQGVHLGMVRDGSGDNPTASVEESNERNEKSGVRLRQSPLLSYLNTDNSEIFSVK